MKKHQETTIQQYAQEKPQGSAAIVNLHHWVGF